MFLSSRVAKWAVQPNVWLRHHLRLFSTKYPDEIEKVRKRESEKQLEPQVEKAWRLLKEDFRRLRKGQLTVSDPKIPKEVDFLIVGGGVIGSSIAYWLQSRAPDSLNIMVAERDPKYTRCSSTLSVGGIRQQFSLPENIKLSMYSSEFLRNIKQHLSVLDDDPPDIQFQPHGYLFLASEAGVEQMEENHYIQRECGAKVQLLRPNQLAMEYPWLNLEGIALGSYGFENEGWFDPWSLLSAFKKKASSLGVKFMNGEIIGFELEDVPLSVRGLSHYPHLKTHIAYFKDDGGEVHPIEFHMVIVAAGPYSGEFAKLLQIGSGPGVLQVPIPVEPRKRYVYTFHCENGPGLNMPFVIDNSGVYARREGLGGMYVCGRSPKMSEEPDNSDLEVDYNFFDNSVWPILAERIPAFEAIKVSSAWAGYYDYNTLDQNAIFGYHPFYDNVFFVTGFSGHGIQMAPGIGRAVAEVVLDKEYQTINLKRFGFDRILGGVPLLEKNIV